MLYIKYEQVQKVLADKLVARGCPEEKAKMVAEITAENSLEGVASHGINRFKRLVLSIDNGIALVDAEPEKAGGFGAFEQWDGKLGLGVYNALTCSDRAVALAQEHGIGCVALRNTNHWLRGGTYGRRMAKAGMVGICFTNCYANMVYYGTLEPLIGTSPLVIALPREEGPIVADVSLAQYSYGKLENAILEGKQLPTIGGYDKDGNLSQDPQAVRSCMRVLPMGMHKGSALTLLLDLVGASMALGNTAVGVRKLGGDEHAVTQVYIAINSRAVTGAEAADAIVNGTMEEILATEPAPGHGKVRYPGQNVEKLRAENLSRGVPVDDGIWADILAL